MTLANAYLQTTKNVDAFFTALLSAEAPDRFTQKFLVDLGFKSTNDRLYIRLLKSLGLIDSNGAPTQEYYNFLDQTQAKQVLAERIRDAYSDLFAIRKDANTMTLEEVKNKLKTLTQGKKSDVVLGLMANTFKALCDFAEWSDSGMTNIEQKPMTEVSPEKEKVATGHVLNGLNPNLQYNINIVLPESRDPAVYDAIFSSLRHILK